MNMESTRHLGLGFIIGILVGAVLGILFAPHSGKVTRGLIDEKAHDASRKAARIVEEAEEKAADIVKKAKEKV